MRKIFLLVAVIFSASIVSAENWVLVQKLSSPTDTILVQYWTTQNLITAKTAQKVYVGSQSLNDTFSLVDGALNQVVYLTKFHGYNTYDGSVFYRSAQTAFLPSDSFPMHGLYWSDPVTAASLTGYKNGAQYFSSSRGSVVQYDTTVAVDSGSYYQFLLTLTYPDGTQGTTTYTYDLSHKTGTGIPIPGQNLCNVYGYVRKAATGRPLKYAKITFGLADRVKNTCSGVAAIPTLESTETDVNGFFSINLTRSSCLGGTGYTMNVYYDKDRTQSRTVVVPDSNSYQIVW